jgi:hypothetical protein
LSVPCQYQHELVEIRPGEQRAIFMGPEDVGETEIA